jgi:hypothetical protein
LMDQEREKLARLEERAEARRLAREAMEEALPSQKALRDGAAGYLRTEHFRGALVEYLTDIAKRLMEQWGDLRAEQVRREAAKAACVHYEHEDHVHCDRRGEEMECPGVRVDDRLRRAFAASQGGT